MAVYFAGSSEPAFLFRTADFVLKERTLHYNTRVGDCDIKGEEVHFYEDIQDSGPGKDVWNSC